MGKMNKPFKCKIKDLCEDLITLGVTKITIENIGLNIVIIDYLKEKDVKVNTYRRNKKWVK